MIECFQNKAAGINAGGLDKILALPEEIKMKFKLLLLIAAMIFTMPGVSAQVPQPVEGWPYINTDVKWAVYTIPQLSMSENIDSSAVYFNTLTNEIIKFHLDGSFYDGWPVVKEGLLFGNTPLIVDIDHDGKNEIVLEGAKRTEDNHYLHSLLYIVDDDGTIFPGFPRIYYRISAPNVADIDDDGEYELIFFSIDDDEIYCIDMYGNSKPGWPIELPENVFGSVGGGGAVGDLDLDGRLEYLLKGYKYIYAYRYDGSMQAGFPIAVLDTAYYFN